jgi:hypothetical protein
MEKKDNLFIKVQLEKSPQSGNLMINIYFDKNAPNFFYTNDTINWYPTMSELAFINETFTLINKTTTTRPSPPPTYTPPPSYTPPPPKPPLQTPPTPKQEEPPQMAEIAEKPLTNKPITTDTPFDTYIEETPKKLPFENDAPPEEILATITSDSTETPPTNEEKLVQADDKSITKALLDKLKKDHY